jgi:hypothetical protein
VNHGRNSAAAPSSASNVEYRIASIVPRVTTGNTMALCVVIGEQAAALLCSEHKLRDFSLDAAIGRSHSKDSDLSQERFTSTSSVVSSQLCPNSYVRRSRFNQNESPRKELTYICNYRNHWPDRRGDRTHPSRRGAAGPRGLARCRQRKGLDRSRVRSGAGHDRSSMRLPLRQRSEGRKFSKA